MSHDKLHLSTSSSAVQTWFCGTAVAPCTRREFARLAVPGVALISALNRLVAAQSPRPNSKFAGVQVGLNVPYSFANLSMSGDEILKNCVQLGLSAVELRTQPVEVFLGAPVDWIHPKKGGDGSNSAAQAEQLAKWRQAVSMDRVKEFRKNYENAGVAIEIVKVDGLFK